MISRMFDQFNSLIANEHFKEVLKGGVVTFGVKILTLLVGFFTTWFISIYYGAGTLGQLALLNSIVGMVTIFTVLGMNSSLVRLVPEHIVKYSFYSAVMAYKKSIIFVTIVSFLIAIAYSFFYKGIAENIFDKSELLWLFILVGPLIFIKSIFSVNISMIQALKNVKVLAFFQLIQPLMFTSFILIGTYLFFDKTLPIYAQVMVNILLLLFSIIVILKLTSKQDSSHKLQKIRHYDLLSLSLPMMITGVFTTIIFQTDTIMIGMMQTDVDVGVYSVVMKLASLTSFVLLSVNTFAAPKYSELYHQGKMEDLKFVAQGFSKILLFITLLMAVIMIIFGQYILSFFGEEFIVGYSALILIVVGWIFNAWAGPVVAMMNMINLHKEVQNIYIIVALVNILLNGLLIPKFGITGAAIASMMSAILINLFTVFIVFKKEGFFILYLPEFLHKLSRT